MVSLAKSELILGGQRSGKSRRAEQLASDWLVQSAGHKAVLIATGTASDSEMHQRIARHQQERSQRVPRMATVEEPVEIAKAIQAHSTPQTIVVVDCLTLWLTNLLMPHEDINGIDNRLKKVLKTPLAPDIRVRYAPFLIAIQNLPGPVVLVGNEIGLGVIPMGRQTRAFVDALGHLNQDVASVCARVVLMAAGLPLNLKNSS